jgi:hypothetical protein
MAHNYLAWVGLAVATVGWLLAMVGALSEGASHTLPFGLGGNGVFAPWSVQLTGSQGGAGYYLKLQDLMMMLGGAILVASAIKEKQTDHRVAYLALGGVSVVGGVSGVVSGWDGNV